MDQEKSVQIRMTGRATLCEPLQLYFSGYHPEWDCEFSSHESAAHLSISVASQTHEYKAPLRLGHILDRIYKAIKGSEISVIPLKTGVIDVAMNLFKPHDDMGDGTRDGVILTEKEVEILTYLFGCAGTIVPREELLKAVWNYADTVETHTVETHIYRLRQKIESDPANPKTVLTAQDGYMIEKI